MTKIATKGACNIIEAGSMNSGSFLGDLIACPTYGEIIEIGKLNVSGTYENNQLVKESDITKYTGKTKNYSFIWGEYDLMTKNGQLTPVNGRILNLRIKQNFLNAPDTNLKITIYVKIFYKNAGSSYNSSTTKTLTVNFTHSTGSDKKYAYTQDFEITFGNSSTAQFISATITSVTIETVNGTSQYEYITNIKDITQNYFVKSFSVATTHFYIDSYADDTTNKIITNRCRISPIFDIPTGTDINNIDIYLEKYNFSDGSSVGVTYNPDYNSATYTFNVIDEYGERGYKLPYFYSKFVFEQGGVYESYAYAIWEPNSTQTGIELTNLILDE